MNLNFGVESLQGALFTSNFVYGKKLDLVNKLSKSFPLLFEKDPTLLPIPDDAPPNLPRVILSDKSEVYKCNIAANRIDFFYNEKDKPKEPKLMLNEFYSNYKNFFKSLKSIFNPQVSRIALVSKLLSVLDESSIDLIKKLFLRKERFGNPFNLELKMLYKEELEIFKINRLITIQSLRKKDNPEDNTGLRLEIDINTLSEIAGNYSTEDIDNFYQLIINKFEYFINQYFENVH